MMGREVKKEEAEAEYLLGRIGSEHLVNGDWI